MGWVKKGVEKSGDLIMKRFSGVKKKKYAVHSAYMVGHVKSEEWGVL